MTERVLDWFLFLAALVMFGVFSHYFLITGHWYFASLALTQVVVAFVTKDLL